MKRREGYVSNSSSSSFLVPCEPNLPRVSAIKLPKEIWKAIERNHVEWNGKKFDMSMSEEWWLTDMVSDCTEQYKQISDIPNVISYLDGNDMPYGAYDEDGEKDYIIFKKNEESFFVLVSDFLDEKGKEDIPGLVLQRDAVKRILYAKDMNKTQKLEALKSMFDF